MTNTNESSHVDEFKQLYDRAEAPGLPKQLSRYRFVSCLTDGEYKKTWILEKSNGQKVLCKYACGEYIAMLRTESTFFTFGKFPFIPYTFDYFETEDGSYLLREYIEGLTLHELIEKKGPLSLSYAVSLMKRLCGCLSRFHSANPPIIYRDLKPDNILLHPSGDCYLIDMGTARTYHTDNSADTVSFGTPDTAAPEQFGARQTDARTDIYSLGILFYYLLTGELKIQDNKLKKLPGKAAALIRKCTAFDPDNRYSRVSEVDAALSAFSDKNGHRRIIAAAAGVCALLAGIFLFLRHLATPPEIVFSSPLLEQAVREELNIPEGSPIYEKDLEGVTRIVICGNTVVSIKMDHYQFQSYHLIDGELHGYGDISDISLLAKMPNLRYLVLDYQNIRDISPLADLPLLTLSLCGNPITDLSALKGHKSLQELYLSQTAVTSLDALSDCAALISLDCSYSPVISLKPLLGLPIRSLYTAEISVTDWESLSELPLVNLYCSYIPAEIYGQFENIPTLRNLTLHNCGITSFDELGSLYYLQRLDIRSNRLQNLDGLENFTNLSIIVLSENPITDLSPLANMKNLHSLDIATGIDTDFSFLNEMPWVTRVAVKNAQLDAVYDAVEEPWFSLVVE